MPLLESSESGETQEACKTLPGTRRSNHRSTAEPLYRWLPQPPFASSYLPCHSTSPHLFYNLPHAPSSLITVLVPCRFHCRPLPLLLLCLFSSSSRAEGLCNGGSQNQPCCSSFRGMSRHFLRRKQVLPLTHSRQQQQQQQHCMQTAVRGRIYRQRRERGGRERALHSVYSWMYSLAAASCTNKIIYRLLAESYTNAVGKTGRCHIA